MARWRCSGWHPGYLEWICNKEPLGGFERTLKRRISRDRVACQGQAHQGVFLCLPEPSRRTIVAGAAGLRPSEKSAHALEGQGRRCEQDQPPISSGIVPDDGVAARRAAPESVGSRDTGKFAGWEVWPTRAQEADGHSADSGRSDQRECFRVTGRRYLFSPFRFATKDR